MNWLIKNAQVCDPSAETDDTRDFCVEEGVIVDAPSLPETEYTSIAGEGIIVTPGFVDLHVHFREPGGEDSETLATGSQAAARGGFTHVVTMPNTTPPTDTPELVASTKANADEIGLVNVLPSACVTVNRSGCQLAPLEALAAAGASSFTDDGGVVGNASLMRNALAAAARLDKPLLQHAVDPLICGDGVIRQCRLASELQLPVFPPEAETTVVARDIDLAADTGGHLHIQHISCKATADLLRAAASAGVRVTSEVTPHHLALCTHDIDADDPNYKMNPPLGTPEDREALLAAVADGTITCLATDHAPHSSEKKSSGFAASAFGVIGLETAAALTYDLLVASELTSLLKWVSLWTTAPAEIISIAPPSLSPGRQANVAIFKRGARSISQADILSKSCNSPFIGRETALNPILTICNGRESWCASDG